MSFSFISCNFNRLSFYLIYVIKRTLIIKQVTKKRGCSKWLHEDGTRFLRLTYKRVIIVIIVVVPRIKLNKLTLAWLMWG